MVFFYIYDFTVVFFHIVKNTLLFGLVLGNGYRDLDLNFIKEKNRSVNLSPSPKKKKTEGRTDLSASSISK